MKVVIVGYGIEGKTSARYWHDKGDEVTVCDKKANLQIPPEFASSLGDDHLKNLHEFDLIVHTPGIRVDTILAANPEHPEISERITTNLNEFLRVCPAKNVIGITGTKGKGTTATLTTKILQAAGKSVRLGGNIGTAPLDMLKSVQAGDIVVLELSSFQLFDLSERIPTAACLMIAPEHLNWHKSLDEYYEAKGRLFALQQPGDRTVYNARNDLSKQLAFKSPGTKQGYDVPPEGEQAQLKEAAYVKAGHIYYQDARIMPVDAVAMPGRHNLENICAAISLAWPFLDGDVGAIPTVVTSFTGLPHHLEYVARVDDITYYNDSYSTMPDATIAALEAIPGTKVLILGGTDKGLPFDNMIAAVAKSDVRHVILIGSQAENLKKLLEAQGVSSLTLGPNDMLGIVELARRQAQSGDVVLLSPGCAAKGDGYFIDNVDRGNQFKAVVASFQA